MRRIVSRGGGLLLALSSLALAGCEDNLPTASGEDRFPEGLVPTTVEIVLPADAFLRSDAVYDGFADPREAGFLLAAQEFDGVLDAHALARLGNFPDSVTFTSAGASRTDTAFTYAAGQITTLVDNRASFSPGPATLRLYALEQGWDSATVTWDTASAAGPVELWRTPGGTRGTLLAEAVWTPGDTTQVDSLVWAVDSTAVARIAADGFPGLLVTSATPGSRVEFSRLSLATAIRPASRPDTVLTRTFAAGPQTFVYTPAAPRPDEVYRVGGLTGARTVLGIDLAQRVPACASGQGCGTVPLRDVTLNRATLLLEPLAVPAGFRPLRAPALRVRQVLEPELGRLAPLGEAFAVDTVPPTRFEEPVLGGPVGVDLTQAVLLLLSEEQNATTVALLGDAGAAEFGYLWFAERPRLRLIYTLPLRPQLP